MMTLSIVPDDPNLTNLIANLNAVGKAGGFRQTQRALGMITTAIARSWQSSVGSDHRIEKKRLTPFTHVVFSRDKVVGWMERGLAPFDMRMTHPKGKKSRIVRPKMRGGKMITSWKARRKDGTVYTVHAGDPYLIVPFRHRTQNQPGEEGQKTLTDVYGDVKEQMAQGDFKRSRVKRAAAGSEAVSPNYWRQAVERAQYSWGSRFTFPEQDEFKNLQGMVAMGGSKQSQFMTFRVVSVNSPGNAWQHPGIKARRYLHNILEDGHAKIVGIINDALVRDIT